MREKILQHWKFPFHYFWFHGKKFFCDLFFYFQNCQIYFFFKYLFHSYDIRQFSPLHLKNNFRVLLEAKNKEIWLTSEATGFLKETSKRWFLFKNFFLFGAPKNRLLKVINFTFITFCIEIYNPFDKIKLKRVIKGKKDFVIRFIEECKKINGKKWNQKIIVFHLNIFVRSSFLQMRLIGNLKKSCNRQKEPLVIKKVKEALQKNIYPILIEKGISGSYWMRGTDYAILGLFKPFDEEPCAPNNPLGSSMQAAIGQRQMREGIRVGEAANHEVAAFIVDQYFGFGIVPRTYYASFTHSVFYQHNENIYKKRKPKKKYGSFQEYVVGFEPVHHLTKAEIENIALDEFQLLVLLDVIIGNTDRNTGNLLVNEEKIAAIDNSLCFPDRHETVMSWYWYFEHGKKPLYPEIKKILTNFPYEKLTAKLRKRCFLSLNACERIRERVALFHAGIDAGYTPSQLTGLMDRKYLDLLRDYNQTLQGRAKNVLNQSILNESLEL